MKMNKARKLSGMGNYGTTWDILSEKLTKKMDIHKLTSKQIGEIIELMYDQKQYGENSMYCELTNNGRNGIGGNGIELKNVRIKTNNQLVRGDN